MTKKRFFVGMLAGALALVLAFGAVLAGCDDGSNTGGGEGLTITGLSEYNGNYVLAVSSSPVVLYAGKKIDAGLESVKVSGGKVTLSVYTGSGAYTGDSEDVTFAVWSYGETKGTYGGTGETGTPIGTVTVTLKGGVGTGEFEETETP
jgi:hypothetical protein